MLTFIVRRLMSACIVLLIVSVVVFAAMHLAPGDPAAMMLGAAAGDPDVQPALEALRREMGLDKPVSMQYLLWLQDVLQGNLGQSIRSKRPVLPLILGRVPATVELLVVGLVLGAVLAVPGGILSAVKRQSWFDYLVSTLAASGIALPNFWLGLMLILLFSVRLKWLPAGGYVPLWEDPIGNIKLVILPGVTLGLYLAAYLTKFLRADLLEVLNEDYIRTARAKGITERRVILLHALRNSLISVFTILGLLIGSLLGGVVIIEQIFGWSGVGWLSIQAVAVRDYPMVQGIVLFVATAFIGANLLTDIAYGLLDPRIRY